MPSAAPMPIFRAGAEFGGDGIVRDVMGNSRPLLVVSNPVIVGFGLPERRVTQTEQFFGATGGKLFPGPENVAQQLIGRWPDHGMDMIGHDDPFPQQIAVWMEVPQGFGD